jgi:predicted transposase/invertase (TIGR01784 family)
MTVLTNPHDAFFKKMLSDVRIARDFLNIHLPPSFKKICDLNSIQIAPGSFVEDNLRQHFSDILYSIKTAKGPGYVHCLIEHVSQATDLTPFQVLRYQIAAMKQHLDQGNKKLPVIIPLIFYRGKTSPYPGPVDIMECFEYPELARQAYSESTKVVDLSVIPDEELKTHRKIALLELFQKHIMVRDVMELAHYLVDQTLYRMLEVDQFRSVIQYINEVGFTEDQSAFIRFLEQSHIDSEYKETMNTVAEYLRNEGRKDGLQAGLQTGRQEGRQEGEYTFLQELLEDAFGQLPERYLKKLARASSETLRLWGKRVFRAKTLAEVFQHVH